MGFLKTIFEDGVDCILTPGNVVAHLLVPGILQGRNERKNTPTLPKPSTQGIYLSQGRGGDRPYERNWPQLCRFYPRNFFPCLRAVPVAFPR